MFPGSFSHRSSQEEKELWNWALTRDSQLDWAINQGKRAMLMPGVPTGTFLPHGAAPPQSSAKVQVQTKGDIPPQLLHLTTQPTGYVSPLMSLSAEGRAEINDPY